MKNQFEFKNISLVQPFPGWSFICFIFLRLHRGLLTLNPFEGFRIEKSEGLEFQ